MRLTSQRNRQAKRCQAMTLVEVIVAVTVLTVVVWGAVAFMVSGRTRVEWATKQRTAAQIALERLERARAAGFVALADNSGNLFVDGTQYSWVLTVASSLADPVDMDSTYKKVEVSVDWPTSQGQAVVFRTAVAP